jgi:hypothetical protein
MKVIRGLVKSAMFPMRFGIIGDEGGVSSEGGAPQQTNEEILGSVFAGNDVDISTIPDPEKPEGFQEVAGSENSDIIPNNQGGVNDGGKQVSDQLPTNTDNWMWDEMQKRLSTTENEWSIPEEITTGKKSDGTDLTQEDRFNMFVENITKVTSEENTDSFLKAYNAAKKDENFSMNKFLVEEQQKQAIFAADDDTFLQAYLRSQKDDTNRQKHSDKEIQDYIAKLNSIEKSEKVTQLKGEINLAQDARVTEQEQAYNKKQKAQFDSWENNRLQQVTDTMQRMSTMNNIAGLPITESDIMEFQGVFDKMTQFNPKTQQLYMDDYLQSNNDNVFKMLYLLHKADKGEVAKHISNVKQTTKDDILNKTGIKPNIQGSSGQYKGEVAPDSKAFH